MKEESIMVEGMGGEIIVLSFYGQGHLFPSMELSKHLSSRKFLTTFIIPSHLSSSIPSSFRRRPFIQVLEIPSPSSPPPPPTATEAPPLAAPSKGMAFNPFHPQNQQLSQAIEAFLSGRLDRSGMTRPVIAVIDVLMSWSKEIFTKFDIPTVSFFTSGACSAAMEYAAWKAHVEDMKPGEIRVFPGLPEDMAVSYSDAKRRPRGPHPHHRTPGPDGPRRLDGPPNEKKIGPPMPGQRPRWLDEVEGSIALLINTSDDLEHQFIDFVANQLGKPAFGVGPLLPEQYWKSVDSILRDREIRSNRQSNYTEDEVIQWLDLKTRGSVIYISFGSEVGPTLEEYEELGNALEELDRPFIWVIQPGSGKPRPPPSLFGFQPDPSAKTEGHYPYALASKVGDRGLIIHGWAPQLMILSHPSTGGFLSHCGWNSTVEAIGRGVPILAWPIRGDQYHDAKLVVSHLKVGYMVSTNDNSSEAVKKNDIVQGIHKLMADEEVHKRAVELRGKFGHGFPRSSDAALDAFGNLITQKGYSTKFAELTYDREIGY